MLNPFRCIPGIVLGLAAVFSTEAADHGKALSVCDVIGNLPSFRDRVVVIQGEYVGGPEQSYITERACPRSFTTFGYTWPNSLKLAAPGTVDTPRTLPFDPDVSSISDFTRAVNAAKATGTLSAHGCIVVTGLVQLKDDYSPKFATLSGQKRGLGFGHMSGMPAQVVMKSVKVVSMEPRRVKNACSCCK